MFQKLIADIVLRYQLARALKLKARVARIEERAALKTRYAQHGTYELGGLKIVRFDASAGYDTAKFFKDNPEIHAAMKSHYAKPGRIEKVRYELKK